MTSLTCVTHTPTVRSTPRVTSISAGAGLDEQPAGYSAEIPIKWMGERLVGRSPSSCSHSSPTRRDNGFGRAGRSQDDEPRKGRRSAASSADVLNNRASTSRNSWLVSTWYCRRNSARA